MAAGRFAAMAEVLTTARTQGWRARDRLAVQLRYARGDIDTLTKSLPGRELQFEPFADMMFELMRPELADLFADAGTYEAGFDDFELLASMVAADLAYAADADLDRMFVGQGRFTWRHAGHQATSPLVPDDGQGDDELAWVQAQRPFAELVAAGRFGGSYARVAKLRQAARRTIDRRPWT